MATCLCINCISRRTCRGCFSVACSSVCLTVTLSVDNFSKRHMQPWNTLVLQWNIKTSRHSRNHWQHMVADVYITSHDLVMWKKMTWANNECNTMWTCLFVNFWSQKTKANHDYAVVLILSCDSSVLSSTETIVLFLLFDNLNVFLSTVTHIFRGAVDSG